MFVVNDLNYFAIHRQSLAQAWLDRGWRVTLLSGPSPVAMRDLDHRIELRLLPFDRHGFRLFSDFSCMKIVFNSIRSERPTLVHAFTIKAVLLAGLAVMMNRKKPALVLTFAGLGKIFENRNTFYFQFRYITVVTLLRSIFRICKTSTTFENNCDLNTGIALGFACPSRSRTINGAGIDDTIFHPPNTEKRGNLRIIMASRMISTKGVQTYIDAAIKFSGCAQFTLTGPFDGEDLDAVDLRDIEEADRRGVIKWLGLTAIDDMGDLLRRHDVAVLPTRLQEGFPRSLLEAGSCGCALIATQQLVIDQIVQPGKTGWRLAEPDVAHLIAALEEAIYNPKTTRNMGLNAIVLISKMKADTPSIVREMAEVYERTMMNGP